MITNVRYTNEEQTSIEVVDDTQGTWYQDWPSGTWRDTEVQAWLDAGNIISPYDPQYGMTFSQIKVAKMREGQEYGRELVRQAHANPYDGAIIEDTAVYREKEQSKRRLRSDKKALGKPLNAKEELDLERAEHLQEYEVLCIETSDEFNELVDEQTTPEAVNALDPATAIVWPIWNPPAL